VVEQGDLAIGQRQPGMRRRRSIEHGEPQDAPAENAEDRHQIGEALGGAQLRVSALQPDFRILWEHSIFHRMAYQLIFSMASARCEPEDRDELPFDRLPAFRRAALLA